MSVFLLPCAEEKPPKAVPAPEEKPPKAEHEAQENPPRVEVEEPHVETEMDQQKPVAGTCKSISSSFLSHHQSIVIKKKKVDEFVLYPLRSVSTSLFSRLLF